MLTEQQDSDKTWLESVVVDAECLKCPAGADGGLCQRVFGLLLVLEHFSPRKAAAQHPGAQSVTSQPRQWGVRARNITLQPVMSLVFEKSKMEVERKCKPVECSLYEAQGPDVLMS